MKKKYKVIILIIIIIGILGALAFGIIAAVDRSAKATASTISIQTTDATGVPDGEYEGSYEAESVKVSVRVTVADEKIMDITILKHENVLGGKAESIINDVIKEQSLKVDVISGATISSKTILKAIENALQSGGK